MKGCIFRSLAVVCLLSGLQSCHKTNPVTTGTNPYGSDSTAISVIGSLYAGMAHDGLNANLSVLAGLSADELGPYPAGAITQFTLYYQDNLGATTAGFEFWNIFYHYISIADSVISGAGASTSLSATVKTQLLGHAYFIRALSYFYLVNLYGDCPLRLTTDTSQHLARSPAAQVYAQIKADANAAATNLPGDFSSSILPNTLSGRFSPTRWAALTLLARSYLYLQDYPSALAAASQVINSGEFILQPDLDSCFLTNSAEAILQLPASNVYPYISATEAGNFIPPNASTVTASDVHLTTSLLQAFEPNDFRRIDWVDSISVSGVFYYFPYKYKMSVGVAGVAEPEAETILRLSELYLIRAEAEAQLEQLPAATSDLNLIRTRAGLDSIGLTLSQIQLLAAIAHESEVELFTEWGHRWLDLKRTGTANAVMTANEAAKGISWNVNDVLYPLPASALQADELLVQNPGY